jgi:hypothetical protein
MRDDRLSQRCSQGLYSDPAPVTLRHHTVSQKNVGVLARKLRTVCKGRDSNQVFLIAEVGKKTIIALFALLVLSYMNAKGRR